MGVWCVGPGGSISFRVAVWKLRHCPVALTVTIVPPTYPRPHKSTGSHGPVYQERTKSLICTMHSKSVHEINLIMSVLVPIPTQIPSVVACPSECGPSDLVRIRFNEMN
jgi:hypothetical protein